jgi:hypothetical protein
VAGIRAPLLEALQQADVAVVSGDTGCGKTTQVRERLRRDDSKTPRTSVRTAEAMSECTVPTIWHWIGKCAQLKGPARMMASCLQAGDVR